MANETLQEAPSAPVQAAEVILNTNDFRPRDSDATAFRDAFSSEDPSTGAADQSSQKILNALLYVVLVSAVLATVRIFWTSAKELFVAR